MGKASKKSPSTTTSTSSKNIDNNKTTSTSSKSLADKEMLVDEYLPPIGLVFSVLLCSGFLFMFAFRDVFATGKVIGGTYDQAMLVRKAVKFC